jgi:hypothetical protein
VVALDGQKTGRAGAKRVTTSDSKLKSGITGKYLLGNLSNRVPQHFSLVSDSVVGLAAKEFAC